MTQKFFTTQKDHPISKCFQSEGLLFHRYQNGELYLSDCPSTNGEEVFLFGSFSPPDENVLKTLLAAHTLKREGAKKVTVVIPFAAYMRHDKVKPGLGLTTAFLGEMIQAASIDEIITMDLHSETDRDLISVPILSLSPATAFAKEIQARNISDATFVAPDNGAVHRCEAVLKALKQQESVTYFEKSRGVDGMTMSKPIGAVSKRCILVDDQLDTGTTLVHACKQLREFGAKEILIFISHGLFNGKEWKKLKTSGVKEIIVTDSVDQKKRPKWVSVISVASLFEKALKDKK